MISINIKFCNNKNIILHGVRFTVTGSFLENTIFKHYLCDEINIFFNYTTITIIDIL